LPETDLMNLEREAVSIASLDHVLRIRDQRAALQRMLLTSSGLPVLSLTLVSPGPVKDSPGRRLLMDLVEDTLSDETRAKGMRVQQHSRRDGIAGPEALWVVDASPYLLKRLSIEIEAAKPWGRLLDADVIVAGAMGVPIPLGRQALGCPPRRCLLCGADAKVCMGLRRHSPATVAARAAELVQRFTGRP